VVASLSFNKSDVIVTNNSGGTHYLFTGNGEFIFSFRDVAGNTGEAKANVHWIDKEVPEAVNVEYSPASLTGGDVVVKLTLNEKGKISEPPLFSGVASQDWQKVTED
jgi:hypothetical protein